MGSVPLKIIEKRNRLMRENFRPLLQRKERIPTRLILYEMRTLPAVS